MIERSKRVTGQTNVHIEDIKQAKDDAIEALKNAEQFVLVINTNSQEGEEGILTSWTAYQVLHPFHAIAAKEVVENILADLIAISEEHLEGHEPGE